MQSNAFCINKKHLRVTTPLCRLTLPICRLKHAQGVLHPHTHRHTPQRGAWLVSPAALLSHESLMSPIFIPDTDLLVKKVYQRGHAIPVLPCLQYQTSTKRLNKLRHKDAKEQQEDFATYTRHINIKTVELGFCNVRPNVIQCIISRERFLQGVSHMRCKFNRRRIRHVM